MDNDDVSSTGLLHQDPGYETWPRALNRREVDGIVGIDAAQCNTISVITKPAQLPGCEDCMSWAEPPALPSTIAFDHILGMANVHLELLPV
eukprot:CAMPEP_0197639120 /NCGR_PEP_ID=MMETSP1338-20131121/13836_1 /TAXON_ID=43686 ORGANISM="Pelagodinium beii, Strain RCC1491" /NCGR_SAMPLE_ID=MMETSP1338 /ASSEMBLY_ACC=CAM_ASM_000754 /LENGTH=90 /DNA_ID=CAMNT_0043211801 /DNA_START=460 /DNA_END=732 /DNA_ORIENTATION=+